MKLFRIDLDHVTLAESLDQLGRQSPAGSGPVFNFVEAAAHQADLLDALRIRIVVKEYGCTSS